MVVAVNEAIKSIDPQVKFGVSPFGIRKNSDAGTTGGEGYHLSSTQIRFQWLTDQSIDYIAPQLYWQRDHEAAPYEPLLNWWAEVSEQHQRHVYIGLAPYRLGEPFNWSVEELLAQLQINRKARHPFTRQHLFQGTACNCKRPGTFVIHWLPTGTAGRCWFHPCPGFRSKKWHRWSSRCVPQ